MQTWPPIHSACENGEDGNQPKSDHEEDGGGDIDIDVDDRGKSDEKGGEGQFASDGFCCNQCPRKFKWKFKLEKHFKAVHDEKTFKCSRIASRRLQGKTII